MKPRRIAILGSTGSVGRQALQVIASEPDLFACALSAGSNAELLAAQATETGAEFVAAADPAAAEALPESLPPGVEVLTGPDAASDLIRRCRPDLVLTAVAGSAGLAPTLTAIECGADLAIANKESLVMAGALVMPAARAAGVNVLPVDSEHSAVFQCMLGRRREDVAKVTLTASGGPCRTWPIEKIRNATLDEVLNHPTWQMGRKVTIDSTTLVNKALEVIEAHWLFDLPSEQIEVLVHPESLVHACVAFSDGSVLAQLGAPSMLTPIAFALHYPNRSPRMEAPPLDLVSAGRLHFEPVDHERFPAVKLGHAVIEAGGTSGAVFSAADEAVVDAFIDGRIGFGQIVEIVEEVMNRTPVSTEITIESIARADAAARRQAEEVIARRVAPAGGV